MTFQELSETEKILFRTMRKVQSDRMDYDKNISYSEGKKQKENKLKKADCMNKESILEAVLREAGLYSSYRQWVGLDK